MGKVKALLYDVIEQFNRAEFEVYVSGTSNVAVAVLMYSLEKEADLIKEDNEIQEYQDVVISMHEIIQKEYNERELDWRAYDQEEHRIYLAGLED